MPTIDQLQQTRPERDAARLERYRALYGGGAEFDRLKRAFLPRRPQEPENRYDLRVREASYRNYVGPILDYFASMLFSSRPVVEARDEGEAVVDLDEFYADLREDCDGRGTDIDAVFKAAFTDAMIARRSWVFVHHPEGEAQDRAEFEERGLGAAWLELVRDENVLDFEVDDRGAPLWLVRRRCDERRESLTSDRSVVRTIWEHWTADGVDEYAIVHRRGEFPPGTTEVPLVASRKHRVGKLPVVRVELPEGLWVLNRLESPQLAHFRISNAQTWGMSATCYAMPVFKVEDPEEFARVALGAGYGFTIKPSEDIVWTAPDAAPFDALGHEVKAQKDEIFRIAHQMALGVENNAAAVGRSAESKVADVEGTRVVLVAYSRIMREAIQRAYELIAAARGEDFDWNVSGLDDFAAVDAAGLADTLAVVRDGGGIPSRTWNVQMHQRLAEALLRDLDESTKYKIREEIEQGTKDPADEAAMNEIDALHTLAKEAMRGPAQGGDRSGGGAKPPSNPGGRGGAPRPPAS